MNIREYEDRLNGALITAKELLSQSGYSDNRTLEYIDYDEDDPNETQRWDELMKASEALLRLTQNLDYIRRPVAGTSQLNINSSGRYEDDFYEYTCGSGIEFLLVKNCFTPRWVHSYVEGDDDGKYYIVGYKWLDMEGLKTRVRQKA